MSENKSVTIKYCFKCRKCSQEFAIYTWYPEKWQSKIPFCPDCGFKEEEDALLLAVHESEESISGIIYHKGIM